MERTLVAALIVIGAFAVVAVSAGGGLGVSELLIVLAIVLVTGITPFGFGFATRLLWRRASVPLAVPWLFGLALGSVRLFAPHLGGLKVLDSTPLAVLFTIALGGSFAQLGLSSAEPIIRHRASREPSDA